MSWSGVYSFVHRPLGPILFQLQELVSANYESKNYFIFDFIGLHIFFLLIYKSQFGLGLIPVSNPKTARDQYQNHSPYKSPFLLYSEFQ